MMQQYVEIKNKHKDSILFFRMGDFYEMFLEDAKEASKILGITLTARDAGPAGKVPMCGVPFHSADGYIAKLINSGRKVAICEQVEDPAQSKGLVRREVVRTITPGTHQNSPPDNTHYLISWAQKSGHTALAVVDYLTGSMQLHSYDVDKGWKQMADEVVRLSPREAAVPDVPLPEPLEQALSHSGVLSSPVPSMEALEAGNLLRRLGFHQDYPDHCLIAMAQALGYLETISAGGFGHFTPPQMCQGDEVMSLDLITRRNLELTRTLRSSEREGSLLWVLDQTTTSMGSRLIRRWVEQPLLDLASIERRLDAVEELGSSLMLRQQMREILGNLYDIERLNSRVASLTANARDLTALAISLRTVGELREVMVSCKCEMLRELRSGLDPHPQVSELIMESLTELPPVTLREGGLIRTGHHAEVDRLRALSRDGKQYLTALEARERESSGIKSLKIGFNKVFGYYLEITKTNLQQVPAHYIRKQTLVNAERFITEELKEYEQELTTAEERLKSLEYDLFLRLRDSVAEHMAGITLVAQRVAELDVLQSFGEVSSRYRYVRPELRRNNRYEIHGGRHPVVERIVGSHEFVPNDTQLGRGEIAVITGPNMAGKSTYMRQVALIGLMAQMGSFVPAERALLPVVDRVFTRVGAADDLFSGQSTFMVEMTETGLALAEATESSLILFDEVGRGTSTYDGMALAQAIMEYVHDRVKATTLFSTHYHELTSLADTLPRCKNLTVAIMEKGREVVFLRRVQPGKASKSYGIHVAELAGLPHLVTERAYALLRQLEKEKRTGNVQISLFDYVAEAAAGVNERSQAAEELLERLRALSCDAMTPLQALTLLHELVERAREVQ
jgi:DNA mismatch repair protein MutS